jgi:hypothetical protein
LPGGGEHTVDGRRVPLLWLQPEDGPRRDESKREAVRLAQQHEGWRAGLQAHKVWKIE